MPSDWSVIADDLTGACDTGVSFARRGYSTRVAFDPGADYSGCDVRVLTTESRALDPIHAARAMERALPVLAGMENARVYKKIDSTLRGHPGIELHALRDALRVDRVLICPAFPEQGRVVRSGRVLVHGISLAQTAFGAEAPNDDLLQLFGSDQGCKAIPLEAVRGASQRLVEILSGPGVFVVDAESSADLRLVARAGEAAGMRLYCGSAGLARALVELLPQGPHRFQLSHKPGPVLIIAGSRATATLEQVEALRQQSVNIVSLSNDALLQNARLEALDFRVVNDLRSGDAVVISVAELAPGDAWLISEVLAKLAAGVLKRTSLGGLILTGGETAAAVCRAIGCASIDLCGEVQPGVVWGRLGEGRYAGLPVITKAGGFGSQQTLAEAVHFLQNQ